jgi:hypothetical protein
MDRVIAFPSVAALIPSDVALLDPEEHVYNAMVEGWKRQQQSRALRSDTIAMRVKLIARLHLFTNAYPWQWTPGDFVQFQRSRLVRRPTSGKHAAPVPMRRAAI